LPHTSGQYIKIKTRFKKIMSSWFEPVRKKCQTYPKVVSTNTQLYNEIVVQEDVIPQAGLIVNGTSTVARYPIGNVWGGGIPEAAGNTNIDYTCSAGTDPEWAVQVNMDCAVGATTDPAPYGNKVALFSGAKQTGADAGTCWGLNVVAENDAQCPATAGLVAFEIDMNNNNPNIPAGAVSGPAYTVGMFMSGSAAKQLMAAIVISGASNMWRRGIYFDKSGGVLNGGPVEAASIEDQSGSVASYYLAGNHIYGINASDAALSQATVAMPNDRGIQQKDSSGVLHNVINQNSSNYLTLGYHGITSCQIAGDTTPTRNNAYSSGTSLLRWTEVWATNGTIQTSDERMKTEIGSITESVLDAWSEVEFVQYKLTADVEREGDDALVHSGVIAQRVVEAFARHGLDALSYGVIRLSDGQDGRYSMSYTEALVMEAAVVRRDLKRIKEALGI
jgi:hypothetical protein